MFPDEDSCLEWLKNYLYPDGIFCQKCGRVTKHHKVASRRSYSCDYCGHHVHPTAGTIYHKSPTPLRTWFYAVFKMASTRCGISAKQLQRETGVTYKTAWRMFKQIRSMLSEDVEPLSGKVEVDETYCGGKRRGKRGRGAEGKTIVAGAVERKGRVVAKVVSDVSSNTLVPFVTEKVLPSSMVFTDELQSYSPLASHGYEHKRIHHASKVYVDGDVHTQTIEGFWSLVKGGIGGVYHSVGAKYLQSYFNEYAFRYNRRHDDMPMFWSVMSQVQKRDETLS
jgi:transposase-like protein